MGGAVGEERKTERKMLREKEEWVGHVEGKGARDVGGKRGTHMSVVEGEMVAALALSQPAVLNPAQAVSLRPLD